MLRLLWTSDAQPRAKNGQPPQRTTGVASASSLQRSAAGDRPGGRKPKAISPIAASSSGRVKAAEIQKRRVIRASSGLSSPSPAAIVRGSSAMPQIGQAPGPSRTISGCIGQVYSAVPGAAAGPAGSSVAGSGIAGLVIAR